jgi:pimeloyl-ACP methyl ester carboxylesterase
MNVFADAPAREPAMRTRQVELSAGTIDPVDTGGDGPPIVLLAGLMMDASLWHDVIAGLGIDHRCIAPTLPVGAQRRAMHAADLSLPAVARLVDELLDRPGLEDVTLAGVDAGGALVQLIAADGGARVGRIVLVSCDAFDHFPPGLSGRTLVMAAKLLPAAVRRIHAADAPAPAEAPSDRVRMADDARRRRHGALAGGDPGVAGGPQRHLRVLRALARDRDLMGKTAQRPRGFDRPALVVWASEHRVMPREHRRRLADLLAQGRSSRSRSATRSSRSTSPDHWCMPSASSWPRRAGPRDEWRYSGVTAAGPCPVNWL